MPPKASCRKAAAERSFMMKKFLALFLVICLSTLIFASCAGDEPSETTGSGTTGSSTTAGTTATTAEETTHVSDDPQIVDSLDYDYVVRTVLDDNKKIIGVAVFAWKDKKATESITIDSEYVLDGVTYPVIQVGVGQGVLSFQSQLKSITIPGSVKTIAKRAFPTCPALTTLNLSEGLEEIGEMAFWGCKSLESVTIPSTVKTIGSNAFADCNNLKSVTISRAFESQIDDIFAGCPNLTVTYID